MISLIRILLTLVLILPVLNAQAAPQDNQREIDSYKIGINFALKIKKHGIDLNQKMFNKGVSDGLADENAFMTEKEFQQTFQCAKNDLHSSQITHPKPSYEFVSKPVKRGAITQTVDTVGTLNSMLNIQVRNQIAGNIQKLYADWNSMVKAGQIIAQINPQTSKAAVAQSKGHLANARAALKLAQSYLTRTQNLRKQDSTSQEKLDEALARVDQASAQVEIDQATLELAQLNLDRCTICSPVDGIVITRNVNEGQNVDLGSSAPPLFVITSDLTKMQIDTKISETDIVNVKEGQEVQFTVNAFPDTTFRGKLDQVRGSPVTVQNAVSYNAVVNVNNSELKLKQGMTTNLSIITAHKEDVLQIPIEALQLSLPTDSTLKESAVSDSKPKNDPATPSTRTVYRLSKDGNKPEPVKIKVGINDGINAEVTSGLKESDQVLTSITALKSAPVQIEAGASPVQ